MRNIYSQSGEDGIFEAIFECIPAGQTGRWAVEFGAWDGKKFSNTCNLISHHDWHGVFIEANAVKFEKLVANYADNPKAICLNAFVTFDGPESLDSILTSTTIPVDFDLLSIDIDGADYYVWESIHRYRPKVVVIEFNPSIPNDIAFVQPRDMQVRQGSSLRAITELARAKGYELICVTELNGIYVRREFFSLFGIEDNSLDALHQDKQYLTQVFQLYDGTLVWHGCKQLLWHGIPIKPERMQVIPANLRFLPDPEMPAEQRRLMREEMPKYA